MFKLSERSLRNLHCVDSRLIKVVSSAIKITSVDFGVIEGLRSIERQKELVERGASRTMKSKHLTGRAVDLMAFIGGRGSWELPLYFDIADAIREAAIDAKVDIRWGGAWNVPNIRYWEGTMEEAHLTYVIRKLKAGKKPFIDGPHFELVTK